jgi:predicted RND superfamily exporter protein
MLRDLYRSLFTATVLVGVAMVLILRNVVAGLLAMLPNLFPIVAVFGFMGWAGLQVDIGTIMTASVALGIAVDDTLHFVTWFRRDVSEGVAPASAVRNSLRHCGKAMLQTTLVCGLGLSVLVLSDFIPTQRFALMMFVLLISALVGDLILLPALLVGPLGSFFRPRQRRPS